MLSKVCTRYRVPTHSQLAYSQPKVTSKALLESSSIANEKLTDQLDRTSRRLNELEERLEAARKIERAQVRYIKNI